MRSPLQESHCPYYSYATYKSYGGTRGSGMIQARALPPMEECHLYPLYPGRIFMMRPDGKGKPVSQHALTPVSVATREHNVRALVKELEGALKLLKEGRDFGNGIQLTDMHSPVYAYFNRHRHDIQNLAFWGHDVSKYLVGRIIKVEVFVPDHLEYYGATRTVWTDVPGEIRLGYMRGSRICASN